eukprot:CAMPEP_0113602820 /NCGR_PEP_ID=MMETSP0017_2-20120614/955_1 /TAXON_ID=2856 /ORGANISM="Cylindrotheca closterium" /LENGTH=1570 /DNA_ID=CAMNT_0000511183 /DNA_START=2723 /DNA_END=7435 /DNA_ORIENTATION=+ /assembly_acc=CAM_ASM_000147
MKVSARTETFSRSFGFHLVRIYVIVCCCAGFQLVTSVNGESFLDSDTRRELGTEDNVFDTVSASKIDTAVDAPSPEDTMIILDDDDEDDPNLWSYDPSEETTEMTTLFEEDMDTLQYDTEESLIIEDMTALPTLAELEDPETLEELESVETLEYDRRKLGNCNLHGSLPCNEDLESAPCSSFSSLVSSVASTTEQLVIPCGECFEVDITDGSVLDRAGGILLEGKLYFPPTSNVTIRTKFIWVVGLLKMDTPNEGNKVTFKMYGDELQVYENAIRNETCGVDSEGGTCTMGSKVIAVMGGRLDIAGTEEDCPSWEKLTASGQETIRPFQRPCEDGECWSEDVIQLRGSCRHSAGHSDALGKYTIACPIMSTGAHIGAGTSLGIQFENLGQPVTPFEYPVDQNDPSKTLQLTLNGGCSRAGHTDHFGKCTVYCPLQSTALVKHGHGVPMTFTSVKPPPMPFKMPVRNGVEVNLKIASTCGHSQGHTDAWGRCVLSCKVDPTLNYGRGSAWSKMKLTSRYVAPAPFVFPVNNGQQMSLTTRSRTAVSWGHTRHRKRCVLYLPIVRTATIRWGIGSPVVFTSPTTGNSFKASRVMHWAWGGANMFYYAEDYTVANCQQAADDFNSAISVGESLEVSHHVDEGYGGNSFEIDKVMHWAHARKWFFFFPSESDPTTCAATSEDFNSKFKVGYNIDVSDPPGPPGGETFEVDGVHHWAWKRKGLFFFPLESDPATCSQTASDFSSKFAKNYGIEVSYPTKDTSSSVGQVALASKGIHHWSWRTSHMFLFSDDTASDFNSKFPPGSRIKLSYLDSFEVNDIQVTPAAARCWKPGTEILLTSHTRSYHDQQVRTIVSSDANTGTIALDEPITKPVSLADHSDFAIEVASLNRRIVFDAESDATDDAIGGHVVIHHTSVGQHIEGVEIRNFGQQGRLGKYPIHFHMSSDSPDSLVKKNVVRNSNQRGYVVHLTNNVTFEENVAFDITGHCYFIEDGAETGNVFRRNLGSGIKMMPAERAIQLGESSGRTETDGDSNGFNGASVFWISNPSNYFYGNVAAGGDKNGYWFETHGLRREMSLGAFEDNEVHSSGRFAFSTYSPGWRPVETAYIRNLKVYRNRVWGAFLHVTTNIYFDGGLFADNGGKDAMISRADNLVFDGTTFIGQSPFANDNGNKVGIHFDPVRLKETVLWEHKGYWKGTTVKNVRFYNHSQPMQFFSHQSFVKAYNAPHYIENVWSDTPAMIEGCMSNDPTIDDLQIEIVADDNGDVTPTGKAGFLVSPKFTPMISNCQGYNGCLQFCEGACLRTVTVIAGNAAFDDDLNMVVTRKSDGQTLLIGKDQRGERKHNRFSAAYTVALPKDDYTIHFESPSSPGTLQWPKHAVPVFEAAPSCANHLIDSDLVFSKPESRRPECDELIYNGDFEGSSWGSEGWHSFHHSLQHSPDGGVGGSGAVATIVNLSQSNKPAQFLDASCVEAGNEYEIAFSYKIVGGDFSSVPRAKIETKEWDATGKNLARGRAHPTGTSTSVDGEWTTLKYQWTADNTAGKADQLRFYIDGGAQKIMVDNVLFTKTRGGRRERRRLR